MIVYTIFGTHFFVLVHVSGNYKVLQHIQYCRAVAALLVVCFHAAGNLAKDKYFGVVAQPFEHLFWFGGGAGVAFFFVLSGFIIHHVHYQDLNQANQLPRYLMKRLGRIYPTYWIIFAGVYILARLTPSLRSSIPTDSVLVLKSLLLVPQDPHIVGGTGAPVLAVAWSLQYEMMFYTVFAIGLVNRKLFNFVLSLAILNIILEPVLGPYDFPRNFYGSYRVLLFVIGMLASKLDKSRRQISEPGWLALGSLITFFAIGMVANQARDFYIKPLFELGYGVTGAVFVLALTQRERQLPPKMLSTPKRIFALVGDASYALYLIHFPMIAVLSKLAIAVFPKTSWFACIALAILVLASIACAVLFYHFLERPILKNLMPNKRSQQRNLTDHSDETIKGGVPL